MELVYALVVGVLCGVGVWLLLRPRTFQVVMGLSILSYGVNLFLFSMGRLSVDKAPVLLKQTADAIADYADPVPQALVLTAIVIGFAMTAFVIILAMRSRADLGSDHVDGRLPVEEEKPS